jgi:hypothetical protein
MKSIDINQRCFISFVSTSPLQYSASISSTVVINCFLFAARMFCRIWTLGNSVPVRSPKLHAQGTSNIHEEYFRLILSFPFRFIREYFTMPVDFILGQEDWVLRWKQVPFNSIFILDAVHCMLMCETWLSGLKSNGVAALKHSDVSMDAIFTRAG